MALRRLLLLISLYTVVSPLVHSYTQSVALARNLGVDSRLVRCCRPVRTCARTGQSHVWDPPIVFVRGEERSRPEMEEVRDDASGECLQSDVVVPDARVVVAPRILNLVLCGSEGFCNCRKLSTALSCG